jgi:hypothetical protein
MPGVVPADEIGNLDASPANIRRLPRAARHCGVGHFVGVLAVVLKITSN